jgi:hypothetical protein
LTFFELELSGAGNDLAFKGKDKCFVQFEVCDNFIMEEKFAYASSNPNFKRAY